MPSVFEKLNLKQQQEILVVDAPPSFEAELLALDGVTVLHDPKKAKAIHFALAFATRQSEVDALSPVLAVRLLLVCHCYRSEGNVIRIISARKATAKESRSYP